MKGGGLMTRRVVDIKGAVEYFGNNISEWLIREAIKRKTLPHFRIGGRILFDVDALDHWVADQAAKSTMPENTQPKKLLCRAK